MRNKTKKPKDKTVDPYGVKPAVDRVYVERLAAALKAAFPEVYPFPDQYTLFERILWQQVFSPVAVRYHELGIKRNDRIYEFALTRDRRNASAMEAALARGETHYEGKPIKGTPGQRYIERYDRGLVEEVMMDIGCLDKSLGEIVGCDD